MRELARQAGEEVLTSLNDMDLLQALSLADADGRLTVGSLLLFGTGETLAQHLPGYEIGFQELAGTEIRANEISKIPLLRAMELVVDWVEARNPEQDVEIGLFRVALPLYATVTIRELIANAMVHRDYTQIGPTLVQLEGGTLTVSNPGGFPRGGDRRELVDHDAVPSQSCACRGIQANWAC